MLSSWFNLGDVTKEYSQHTKEIIQISAWKQEYVTILTNKWIFTIYASIYRIEGPNRFKNQEKGNEVSGDSSTDDLNRQSTD